MMINLNAFIKRFGIFEGVVLYMRFRYGRTEVLRLSELRHPLYMTPNTIDNCSFEEVFLNQEYSFDYPKFNDGNITIIDAGANIGFGAVYYANKFPNANIIAVEPDENNFLWLQRNTASYSRITSLKGAIWYADKLIKIVDEGWGTRGYMVVDTVKEKSNTTIGYSIRKLMSTYNIDYIDILKMDVEGSEKEIFESNYETWLPKTKCLIIELHDRMRKGSSSSVFAAVSKYNFTKFESGENVVFINNDI